MSPGRNTGKKITTMRIVELAFDFIHQQTGENPVQILVDAVVNSGARQDLLRTNRLGLPRRETIDTSPLHRINQALASLCAGARKSSFRSIKPMSECLADELINAARQSSLSFAVREKDLLERLPRRGD